MIKTFRGILLDGGQDTIRLATKQGKIGYRIVKFQIITNQPTTASAESVVKIYKVKQTAIDYKIDFSDGNLLAVALWSTNVSAEANPEDSTVIFDLEIFNQDIYVTHDTTTGSEACNYYIELEVMKLSDNEATVSTLMDIRGSAGTDAV